MQVHRAPQPVPPDIDRDDFHPGATSSPRVGAAGRIRRAMSRSNFTDRLRLVSYMGGMPRGQQFFDHVQARQQAVVRPHRAADRIRRKPDVLHVGDCRRMVWHQGDRFPTCRQCADQKNI
jgi:hypothetical protein